MTEKYALVTFAYPIVLRRANKDSSPIVAAPVRGCSGVHFEPNFRGRGTKSSFLTPRAPRPSRDMERARSAQQTGPQALNQRKIKRQPFP